MIPDTGLDPHAVATMYRQLSRAERDFGRDDGKADRLGALTLCFDSFSTRLATERTLTMIEGVRARGPHARVLPPPWTK